ncbi:MAG: hypothetical protein ACKE8R_01805 [Methylophagaceae bacterium]
MKALWLGIFVLCLAACDGDPYSGFGATCTEGHPTVAHARSLPQEQLALLYRDIYRLRENNKNNPLEYGSLGEAIPDNFKFLNAVRIRPNDYRPHIMLAGCMDEFVSLSFYSTDSEKPGIVLSWAAGTNDSPYAVGSEVLWSPN